MKKNIRKFIVSNCLCFNTSSALLRGSLFSTLAIAQPIISDVLVSSSGYSTSIQGDISWTIGEPVIETVTNGTTILTQGFLQSNLNVTVISDELKSDGLDVTIYPNPVNDLLTIKCPKNLEMLTIELYDISGVLLLKQQEIVDGQIINMKGFSTGSYILKMYNQNQNNKISRIVKQ